MIRKGMIHVTISYNKQFPDKKARTVIKLKYPKLKNNFATDNTWFLVNNLSLTLF